MTNAGLGFPAPFFVFGNPRRFFEEHPQFFGPSLDQLGNHALLDDGVAAWAEAGAKEHIHDVPTTAAIAVEEVGGLSIPADLTADRNLAEGRVLTTNAPIGVVEQQFDAGHGCGLACARAIEDHIGKRFTAQLPRRAFSHHPTHRINDVGLATAVRPNNGAQIPRKNDGGRVDK